MKKYFILTALFSCVLMLFAHQAISAKYTMKISGVLMEPSPWYIPTDYMEKRIEKLTNGAIDVQQFKGGKLGGERQALEGMQMGTLEGMIGSTGTWGNFLPEADIFTMPYLFKSNEQAFEILDGPYGQAFSERWLKATGLRILAWGALPGLRGIVSSKPIRKLSDLKGLKIRVMETKPLITLYKAYGAIPVPMGFTDVYQALQQGTVDGCEVNVKSCLEQKFDEVTKYYTDLNELLILSAVSCSEKWYQSLPKLFQDIVKQSAIVGMKHHRKALPKQLKWAEEEWIRRGKKLFRPDLKPFREIAKAIYPKFEDILGKENLDWVLMLQQEVGHYRQVKAPY